jgi:hypothetical protein
MSDRKSNAAKSPPKPRSARQPAPPAKRSYRQRVESFLGIDASSSQARKREPRSVRDHRRQQMLIVGLALVGVVTVLVIAGGALNEYFLKPRKVLASVEDRDITRREYWKYREYSLINQATQYQQFAMMVQGEQQQQYLILAQQARAQLNDVWGSTDTDPATLNRMVEDQVYLQGIDELGLSITDQEVDDFVLQQFQPADSPIFTPTPSPTLIPERADWATQTAEAIAALETAESAATPAAVDDAGTPVAVDEATPAAVDGTPVAIVGTPEGTPEPMPTLSPEEARQTAEANLADYDEQVLDLAHMSIDDYSNLIARPSLARQKVESHFRQELGQRAEQVRAAHILVGTEELANRIYEELQTDPFRFAEIAREQSIDEGTAPNGGELGWFPRGIMTEPFEEIAFALPAGEISEPFETEFGWHIVLLLDRDEARALTDQQITDVTQRMQTRWVEEQREAMEISSTVEPTPTPAAREFVPPASAPDAQDATPLPAEARGAEGTPVAAPTPTP